MSRLRFFVASIAVHFAVLLLLYPGRSIRMSTPEIIPVSLLSIPAREPSAPVPARSPRSAPSRPAETPAIIAKKDSRPAAAKPRSAPLANDKVQNLDRREPLAVKPLSPEPPPTPAPRESIPEQSVVAERQLPTLKELLPPANWVAASRGAGPVSLNTRDPIYVSYFNKIKQLIESHWDYPELALRYGLQGRLSLEFTIGAGGQLEQLRLVRSSGSELLDEEALRAIKAASPFPPIPPWVKPKPLSISASMEYLDNRLNYRFAR